MVLYISQTQHHVINIILSLSSTLLHSDVPILYLSEIGLIKSLITRSLIHEMLVRILNSDALLKRKCKITENVRNDILQVSTGTAKNIFFSHMTAQSIRKKV